MSIEIKNVTKYYGQQKALDNISFEVNKGEIVGFIGPNGAGKSTTMKIITGYIQPSSGEVKVDGLKVDEDSLEIRRKTGYLPENNPLYPEMYIEEYLEFTAGIFGLKNKKQRIKEVIELTGLTPEKTKKIGQLSKGYRQRVGLAAAIIHNPEVLILDEPTSGLDPNQIVEIRNLISDLGKEKTVLLSTHIMQEVEAICDRIIIIDKGKIVADDTLDNIHNITQVETQTFLIEFDKDIARERLEAIEGVQEVHYIKGSIWVITSIEDIRKNLFDFAVKNNLTVLSMQKKTKTLEEIFRELTGN